MSDKIGREALRGAEGHAVDLIFEVLTSEEWAGLLGAPLERAVAKGHRDLAQRLVRAGAEIGDALHEAIRSGHIEIVSDLLESGASLSKKDKDGFAPLHLAAAWAETEIIQLLLLKGADKDVVGHEQATPLYLAASQGHVAATVALLAAGADVSLRFSPLKVPVIHMATNPGYETTLGALIEHGADVEAENGTQETTLHAAAWFNNAEAIDVLVRAGANIEACNHRGRTPFHLASGGLKRDVLPCLLKHGATVDAQDGFLQTPLILAASKAGTQGAAEVVDYLLRAGADETIVKNDGRKASDVIGAAVEEEDRLADDIQRVRKLLANAPADRAWRRRGYLVLCRSHPDRVQQKNQVISGAHHIDAGRRTRSRAELAMVIGEVARDSTVNQNTGGDWAVVVTNVLQLQEEGIFRTIVGYL